MEISIIMPAYQEAENLKNILPKINDVMNNIGVEYEILVVDTMESLDNTYEVCKNNHHCLHLNRENGNNYGDAIRTGIKHAKGRYLVVMDSDGSHRPQDISRFYKEIQSGYHLIIASRYMKGGKTNNNVILKMMSYLLNLSYSILFHIKARDISNSYRMYKATNLKSLKLESDNFDIVEEILIKLLLNKEFKYKEIPTEFYERQSGESKRDLWKFIASYLVTMKKLYRFKIHNKRKSYNVKKVES